MQSKRSDINAACDAGMQSALVFYQIVNHPWCSRSTGNKHNITTASCPTIPEVLQCSNKVRLLSVNPRHFVNKYHFLSVCIKRFKVFFKCIKSIEPIGKLVRLRTWELFQRTCKTRKLSLAWKVMSSYKCKIIVALIILINKKSLTDSSSPIHYHKFRAIGLHNSFEFLTLPLSANKFIHHAHTIVY